jgi:DNA-binding SARP family transcriptional activator
MEVVDDSGAPVELRGTKLRCLLAILALRPGHVVAADRIVEDLWGAGPPPNAANSLQALVSRLRRALPPDVVATRAHGYVLATAASNVDTLRFGELAAAGRRALSDGDAPTASSALGDALALWRGDALSDFAFEEFAQPSIVRLGEERASVLEDRIEADLRRGRHAELVAELESAVSAQPLRERLRGQLMIALYRTGRQADALRQFQDARSTLAEELGLEPGPKLRRLERAVLAQDPDLDLAPAHSLPTAPPPRRRRGNLRAPLSRTVGRDGEIAELQSMLENGRLVTLVGPGGVGKTRLAVETARALDERP